MNEQRVSSIWTPWILSIDQINNRVRLSMNNEIIDNEEKLIKLLSESIDLKNNSELNKSSSRITLRFISKNWFINKELLSKLWLFNFELESESKLSGRYDWYSLVYLWQNEKYRLSKNHLEIKKYQDSIISKVTNILPNTYIETSRNFEIENTWFKVDILDKITDKDITEIVDLYKWAYYNPNSLKVEYPFELNEENVSEMLNNKYNIIWAIRNHIDEIISIWIWEIMESNIIINWNLNSFNIMEISDTATKIVYDEKWNIIENLWWKWFNKRLVFEIIKKWFDKYWNNLDLVFWEVRAALDSVNYLAKKTWRDYNWTLSNSVLINWLLPSSLDNNLKNYIRNHKYGDLNVMSMNNEKITDLYSN